MIRGFQTLRTTAAAVAVLLAVGALAGCGHGSDDSGGIPGPKTTLTPLGDLTTTTSTTEETLPSSTSTSTTSTTATTSSTPAGTSPTTDVGEIPCDAVQKAVEQATGFKPTWLTDLHGGCTVRLGVLTSSPIVVVLWNQKAGDGAGWLNLVARAGDGLANQAFYGDAAKSGLDPKTMDARVLVWFKGRGALTLTYDAGPTQAAKTQDVEKLLGVVNLVAPSILATP